MHTISGEPCRAATPGTERAGCEVSALKLWTIQAPTALLVSGALLLLLMPPCLHGTSGSPNRSVMDLGLPQGWTNVTGSVSPAALGGGMMSYDSSADLRVLVGG